MPVGRAGGMRPATSGISTSRVDCGSVVGSATSITTVDGVITPVRLEQQVEAVDGVDLAAVVGVGPSGTQQIVVVVRPTVPIRSARLADLATHDVVRAAVAEPVAAVFEVPALPVDRRHNSKIDRTRLSIWATDALAGGRVANP